VGRRLLLIGGPIGRGLAFFALAGMAALKMSFAMFATGLFFTTLLGGFFQNSANAYITDITDPESRPAAFSKTRVGLNVGWMLGPAIGSFLARTPFALIFCVTATLCLVTAIIPYKFCPPVSFAVHNSSDSRNGSLWAILRRDHRLTTLLCFTLLFFLSVSQFVSTLSIYSTKIVGISRTSLGFLYTINGVLVIIFLIPLNTVLKKVDLVRRMGGGALLYVVAYLGFGISATWSHLALSMVLMTVGEMITLTAIIAAVSDMAPPQMIGRYMGLHGLVRGLGWATGPYLGSLLFERFQHSPLFLWSCLATGALMAGIGYLVWSFAFQRSRAA
jgi:predicted MFS family arabinose efflux permease